jgi:hypothetical protein
MLINFNQVTSSHIKANDGELGNIKDVYFDDRHWTVRFLVVDTSRWLPLSQKVLLSPIAMLQFNPKEKELKVSMTKEMVKNSPKVEEHEPVSREFETQYFDHFGYGYYWTGTSSWGDYAFPSALFNRDMIEPIDIQHKDIEKHNHLRSAQEVKDYGIKAIEESKGYISDFVWDTYDWSLKYVVIDTRNILPGGVEVLVAPQHIKSISWESKQVICNLSVAQIKSCPEYHESKLDDAQYMEQVAAQFKH